jgi:hypothetical protein
MAALTAKLLMYQVTRVRQEHSSNFKDPENKPWSFDILLEFALKDHKTGKSAKCEFQNKAVLRACPPNSGRRCSIDPKNEHVRSNFPERTVTAQGDPSLKDFNEAECEAFLDVGGEDRYTFRLQGILHSRNAGGFYIMLPVPVQGKLWYWPEHHSPDRHGRISVVSIT